MLFETVANRRLRIRLQESTSSLTPVLGVATLPTDYLLWRRVTWTGSSPRELEYVNPSYLHGLYPDAAGRQPAVFHHRGDKASLVRPEQ